MFTAVAAFVSLTYVVEGLKRQKTTSSSIRGHRSCSRRQNHKRVRCRFNVSLWCESWFVEQPSNRTWMIVFTSQDVFVQLFRTFWNIHWILPFVGLNYHIQQKQPSRWVGWTTVLQGSLFGILQAYEYRENTKLSDQDKKNFPVLLLFLLPPGYFCRSSGSSALLYSRKSGHSRQEKVFAKVFGFVLLFHECASWEPLHAGCRHTDEA